MELKELSRNQKLSIVMMVAVIALLFVANSVALGLFAVSTFIMYGAVGVAVTLAMITLVLTFVGKRKHSLSLPNVPLQVVKKVSPAPIEVTSPVILREIAKDFEPKDLKFNYLSSKSATSPQINKQSISKPVSKSESSYLSPKSVCVSQTNKQQVAQHIPPTKIEKTTVAKEAKLEKSDKTKCSSCSKEFSQPLLMADYSNPNQPGLVPHCPYCFKPTVSKQKDSADEETWKKYV
jgi:hypothetical protein